MFLLTLLSIMQTNGLLTEKRDNNDNNQPERKEENKEESKDQDKEMQDESNKPEPNGDSNAEAKDQPVDTEMIKVEVTDQKDQTEGQKETPQVDTLQGNTI